MSTPHNTAVNGDIAKVVLMPGDPLRAKVLAEQYLTDVTQFNEVRGMLGYTGYYKGHRVSVMGSGMGCPSMGIYSYELFAFYGVEAIIRIGTTGGLRPPVQLYDVVLVTSSYSESTYAKVQSGYKGKILKPDARLCRQLRKSAEKLGYQMTEGRTYCSDVFYVQNNDDYVSRVVEKYDCITAEMETFALFHNAKVLGKKAAALLTVSDLGYGDKAETTPEERQNSFTRMMEIALGIAKYYK